MIAAPEATPQFRSGWRRLSKMDPDLVLDIGANVGESLVFFRALWPGVPVYSFEPRPNAADLLRLAAEAQSGCKVFPFALGEERGEVDLFDFYESDGWGGASSLLPATDLLRRTRSWARRYRRQIVGVERLDDVVKLAGHERVFVKVDAQGYEDRIIRGGPEIFSRAVAAVIEVEHEPLYEGAPGFDTIDELLAGHGLKCAGAVQKTFRGALLSWADWLWLK